MDTIELDNMKGNSKMLFSVSFLGGVVPKLKVLNSPFELTSFAGNEKFSIILLISLVLAHFKKHLITTPKTLV